MTRVVPERPQGDAEGFSLGFIFKSPSMFSRIVRNLRNEGVGATDFDIAQLRDFFFLGANMSASVSPHLLAIW